MTWKRPYFEKLIPGAIEWKGSEGLEGGGREEKGRRGQREGEGKENERG